MYSKWCLLWLDYMGVPGFGTFGLQYTHASQSKEMYHFFKLLLWKRQLAVVPQIPLALQYNFFIMGTITLSVGQQCVKNMPCLNKIR